MGQSHNVDDDDGEDDEDDGDEDGGDDDDVDDVEADADDDDDNEIMNNKIKWKDGNFNYFGWPVFGYSTKAGVPKSD